MSTYVNKLLSEKDHLRPITCYKKTEFLAYTEIKNVFTRTDATREIMFRIVNASPSSV